MRKSLSLLTHPATLTAIGLMAANDLLLKPLWPSWITGKLSDLAGLFFLPFLLAALFALPLLALRLGKHTKSLAPWLAFGLVGGAFTLVKLSPAAAQIISDLFLQLTGMRMQLVPDPGDLLTLPALLAAAWLWHTTPEPLPGNPQASGWRRWVLPLALLVTLGDMAAPDLGVVCLRPQGKTFLAYGSPNFAFRSPDGGLTWQEYQKSNDEVCSPMRQAQSADGKTAYRILDLEHLERSTDGGKTWAAQPLPGPAGEAEVVYRKLTRPGNITLASGIQALAIDPDNANLLLAMGQDGVLILGPDGESTWAGVGRYRRAGLIDAGLSGLYTLLGLPLFLAIAAGLLWWNTRSLRLSPPSWRPAWIGIGWALFIIAVMAIHPNFSASSYTLPFSWIIAFVTLIWGIAWTVVDLVRLSQKGKAGAYLRWSPWALAVAVLFFLPYLFWGLAILPFYLAAALISVTVLAMAVFLLP